MTAHTQPNALAALKVIAEFPITDHGNMDAHIMAKLAFDALAAMAVSAQADPVQRVLAGMMQSTEGCDPDQPGTWYRKGWNDALRRTGEYLQAGAAQPAPVVEPVPYTRSPFKNGSQWVTFNIRAEHAYRAARALDGAPAACEACRENSANKHFLDALASAADGEGSEL